MSKNSKKKPKKEKKHLRIDTVKTADNPVEASPVSNNADIKRCFISHCSDDNSIMTGLTALIGKLYNDEDYGFFNSYSIHHGLYAGEDRSNGLRDALQQSELMLSIVTDNYLRSIICISEISAFWYKNSRVVPIIFTSNGDNFLYDLMGVDVIYIDAKPNSNKQDSAIQFLNTMKANGFIPNICDEEAQKYILEFFENAKPTPSKRCFIGSNAVYNNVFKYCEDYGVQQISSCSMPIDKLKTNLGNCNEIFILSTTGNVLVHLLSDGFFQAMLRRGANITVLLPNRMSDFCNDVAEIESGSRDNTHTNRLSNEFKMVVANLKKCVDEVSQEKKYDEKKYDEKKYDEKKYDEKKYDEKRYDETNIGHIYIGCAYNLLRQTITLGVTNDYIWGRVSITIPPKRTASDTPSVEFQGSVNDNQSIAKMFYMHIQAIKNIAVSRGDFVEILPNKPGINEFYLERTSAEEYWSDLYQKANNNMYDRHFNKDTVLIEVAAQHPLKSDGTPEDEFAKRLDCAIRLYNDLINSGKVVKMYVPGSIHCTSGVADPVSLSSSGCKYLLEHGIPENALYGDNMNKKYKGDDGVYNSADECFVATRIFYDEKFQLLYSVCSPNQMLRKKLFYIAFGVLPYFNVVNAERMYHNDINELFHSIPTVLYRDHTWQGNSEIAAKLRAERKPRKQ